MSKIFVENDDKIPTNDSSKDIVETSEEIKEDLIEEEAPSKKTKSKKPMSDERKEKLREQLKKGRETSAKNRAKKAKLKKIDKEAKNKEEDKKLAEYYTSKTDKDNKDKQLNELRLQLEDQRKIIGELREGRVKKQEPPLNEAKELLEPLPKIQPNREIKSKPIDIPKPQIPKKKILWVGLDD